MTALTATTDIVRDETITQIDQDLVHRHTPPTFETFTHQRAAAVHPVLYPYWVRFFGLVKRLSYNDDMKGRKPKPDKHWPVSGGGLATAEDLVADFPAFAYQ